MLLDQEQSVIMITEGEGRGGRREKMEEEETMLEAQNNVTVH